MSNDPVSCLVHKRLKRYNHYRYRFFFLMTVEELFRTCSSENRKSLKTVQAYWSRIIPYITSLKYFLKTILFKFGMLCSFNIYFIAKTHLHTLHMKLDAFLLLPTIVFFLCLINCLLCCNHGN